MGAIFAMGVDELAALAVGPDEPGILALARDGNQEAVDWIVSKYQYLVRAKAWKYARRPLNVDDLAQDGLIGVLRAIRDYDPKKPSSFGHYAMMLAEQAMSKSTRRLHEEEAPFEALSDEDDLPTVLFLAERRPDLLSAEALAVGHETRDHLVLALRQSLTERERTVLELLAAGHRCPTISKLIGRNSQSVRDTLRSIRSKLRSQLRDALS